MKTVNWRQCTDWAKKRPLTLRAADWLGRGRGRLRILDRLNAPAPAPRRPDLSRWNHHDLAAVWIGHATVLLRIGQMTILTDPVMANRVGVGLGLVTGGPRRLVAPALDVRELPPLDLILISHAHFDHLDRPTLARLPKNAAVITAPGTMDLIRDLGFRRIIELQWGQSRQLGPLRITARQVIHWGARTFFDRHRGYNAYLIETDHRRVLYGGDSAYHDRYRDLGEVDLGIVGIGAYDPYIAAHATPEQAWEMINHARAAHVLPMHHSTFRLSHEPINEPMERLLTVAGHDADRIIIQHVGDQWRLDN
ncbi:MAG: MBL fold metallo-hydrolase [Phycisphaerales bacterium]|nr:MBL fold metallo-hydrolase [Phycisphaerales bacterium]